MEENIPQAMTGEYPLSLDDLVRLIDKQKVDSIVNNRRGEKQKKEEKLKNLDVSRFRVGIPPGTDIPTWQQVFLDAHSHTQRVLVEQDG